MSSDFDTLLDQCLARLQTGESLDTILREYPDDAARLRPLLEVATRVYTLPAPRARSFAYTAARQRMLAAVDERSAQPRLGFWAALLPDFNFLRQLPGLSSIPAQVFNLAVIALLIIGLAWVFSSLDLDGNPAGKQTPTVTLTPTGSPTPTESLPTSTPTVPTPSTETPSPLIFPTLSVTTSVTITPSPTSFPTLPLFTPSPSPTSHNNGIEPTQPQPQTPTLTPTVPPPYPPPPTETPPVEPTATPTEGPTVTLIPENTFTPLPEVTATLPIPDTPTSTPTMTSSPNP